VCCPRRRRAGPFVGTIDDVAIWPYAMVRPPLLVRYRFDETTGVPLDTSGNNFHGTNVGTPGRETRGTGNALSLNGASTTYVRVGNPASLTTPPSYTLEAWVYDRKGNGTTRSLFATRSNTYLGRLMLNSANRLQMDGCTQSTASVPTALWTHVAVTWNGSTLTYYVNGTDVGSFGCTYGTGWSWLVIGWGYYNADFWNGAVDAVQLWDVVRTAAEIQADMSEL
jgi:hypothetical protein